MAMTINGTGGAGTSVQAGQLGMPQANDPVSKTIQNQIADAQKQLQELSSNKDISVEEKSKKRQEIQQQINDLNMQLRQHQIELRREKQKKKESFDDMLGGNQNVGADKNGGQEIGLSAAGMEAMITADTAMGQARIQGSVASKMEGRAGVLKAEIKLDGGRGWNVEAKQEELAEVEQKAMDATASQISSLGKAIQTMEESTKEDKSADKTAEEEKEEAIKSGETPEESGTGTDTAAAATADAKQDIAYTPVDVRI